MENFFTRYKNPLVLMAVLVIQVIALATQVRRPDNARAAGAGGPRLIRVWTVTTITPFEKALVATGHFFRDTWHNYIDLHDVRRQNRELQQEIERMRLEQARLRNDADQSRRLQALLDFKERYAGATVAAQVIGSSGSEQSRVIYIDKGSRAGIRQDMAVITPDGIVGKVRDVYPFSSQVLMISDRDSGAGVILVNSRLQGILRGKELGEIRVNDILADEKVAKGEEVITSGGDRIYPKGLPVGTVIDADVDPETNPFLRITIKPAANLNRLEEVLVVTKVVEAAPEIAPEMSPEISKEQSGHHAAAAGRLPAFSKNPEANKSEEDAEPKPAPQPGAARDQRPVISQTSSQQVTPQQENPHPPSSQQPNTKKPAANVTANAAKTALPEKKPAAKTGDQPNRPQPSPPDNAEKPPR